VEFVIKQEGKMAILLTISAIISVIAGVVVLVWPKTLSYAVGIWLLINGILQILYSNNILA
jgi:uncharacterized membrane protein HdeD (DUF308 family)